jgi:N-acetylglucosaminyl-diphospho-decaprenol L-rhamnosyltransferase
MRRAAGIVIVTHNSEECILACLESALARSASVTVVDNASEDRTCEMARRAPGVHLIANRRNLGFAGAVNQAVAALDCDFVLLLNPDAELLNGLDDLVAACQETRVAAAAGKLVDEQGEPQRGFNVRRFPTAGALAFEALGLNRLFPGNPVNRRYRCADFDPEWPAAVEQPAGAFLMLRRDVWRELGGMDEAFHPVFFEEVDFLKRAVERGYRVRYVPSAVARHRGGHSVRRLPQGWLEQYWYGSLLTYASKHFRRAARTGICVAVVLGSVLRMAAGLLRDRNLEPVFVHGTVIQLAGKFLLGSRKPAAPERTDAAGSVG